MSDSIQNSVLLSNFYTGRRRYKVFYHQGKLIWEKQKPPSGNSYKITFIAESLLN